MKKDGRDIAERIKRWVCENELATVIPVPVVRIDYTTNWGFVARSGDKVLLKDELMGLIEAVIDDYVALTPEERQELVDRQTQQEKMQAANVVSAPQREPVAGYIYLLKADKYYKIGRSVDVDQRLTQIEPQLPFQVELFHAIKTNDMVGVEAQLHKAFAQDRANGEWFSLDLESVMWFLDHDTITLEEVINETR